MSKVSLLKRIKKKIESVHFGNEALCPQSWLGSRTQLEGWCAQRILSLLGDKEGFPTFLLQQAGRAVLFSREGPETPDPYGPVSSRQCHSHTVLVLVSPRPGRCASKLKGLRVRIRAGVLFFVFSTFALPPSVLTGGVRIFRASCVAPENGKPAAAW